jgi:hypothetical protein
MRVIDYFEQVLRQKKEDSRQNEEKIKLQKESNEKERKDNIRSCVIDTRYKLMQLASELSMKELQIDKDANLTQKQANDIMCYLHDIRVAIYKLYDME